MKFNLGIVGSTPSGGGGGYTSEALALFARMSPAPSTPRKGVINNLISALISAGVWAKLDALYLLAADAPANALLNWIGNVYNCSAVGTLTFTTDRGYTGDGASGYLNTGLVLNAASKFTQNSHVFGRWMRTGGGGNSVDLGALDAVDFYVQSNSTSLTYTPVDSSNATFISASPVGDIAISRSGSTSYSVYKTGASVASTSSTSGVLPGYAAYILARNGAGSPQGYSSNEFSCAYFGGALTGTEMGNLHTALQSYMTAIGA